MADRLVVIRIYIHKERRWMVTNYQVHLSERRTESSLCSRPHGAGLLSAMVFGDGIQFIHSQMEGR